MNKPTDTHPPECDCTFGPDFIERMEKALAGPRYLIPAGMTPEEICDYITKIAKENP